MTSYARERQLIDLLRGGRSLSGGGQWYKGADWLFFPDSRENVTVQPCFVLSKKTHVMGNDNRGKQVMSVHCCAEHAHKEGLFDRFLSPWLIHGACSLPPISEQRQKIVPLAEGVIVELGMGTGLNMPFYNPDRVKKLIGVDPGRALMNRAQAMAQKMPFDVDLYIDSAEQMPLDDNSADTVVVTYSFCTIPDNVAAVREARRILRPGGRLLFSEHGVSDRSATAKWQNRINPLWKKIAGGCHLNRNVEQLLLAEGFAIEELEKKCMTGVPGVLGYNYRGIARPR